MGAIPLSEIVNVNITLASAAVPQPAFSVALILGTSARIANVIKYYTSAAAMLSDGFLSTDPEYKRAVELMEQAIQPVEFAVSCNAPTSLTQENTVTITAVTTGDTYNVTLNGQTFSYTAVGGDTTNTVLSALQGLINAAVSTLGVLSAYVSAGAGSITLQAYNSKIQVALPTPVGAVQPGLGFSIALGGTGVATMVNTVNQANVSLTNYLATVQVQDQGYYGINICSINWYDILEMAATIEPQTLIFIATSSDAEILDSTSTGDVLTQLTGKAYTRTALLYSGQASSGADSGWTGTSIALTPGASTWGNTPIVGITPDALTPGQLATVAPQPGTGSGNKIGNVYVTVGGNNLVLWGQAVGGRFMDITVGLDWLKSEIQTSIFASIVAARAAGSKIPYTDKGTSIFIGDVTDAINTGIGNGLIDPTSPISVTAPSVASQTTSQRTNRIAPPIAFTCRLSGAYSTATVNGVVSV